MSKNANLFQAAFDAARAFIRLRFEEKGCVVGIGEVLEHLDKIFGEDAGLTSDVPTVLDLVFELWEDPNIQRVPGSWIDFCWDGETEPRSGITADLSARLRDLLDRGRSGVSVDASDVGSDRTQQPHSCEALQHVDPVPLGAAILGQVVDELEKTSLRLGGLHPRALALCIRDVGDIYRLLNAVSTALRSGLDGKCDAGPDDVESSRLIRDAALELSHELQMIEELCLRDVQDPPWESGMNVHHLAGFVARMNKIRSGLAAGIGLAERSAG